MRYEIVPGSIRHIRPMSRAMRSAGAAAIEGFGFNPRAGLRRAFVASHHVRTALIDGRPVAIWGLAGSLLAHETTAWLVLSDEAGEMPIAIVREARQQLASAAQDYEEVVATVLPEDERSVRFAEFLGFKAGDKIAMGDGYVLKMHYARKEAA